VALILILSVLPTAWLGWVGDLSSIVRLPVAPLNDLGNSAASWLRPVPAPHAELPHDAKELVQNLEEQRDRYERLYHATSQRIIELEEQLVQLQQVPLDTLEAPVSLLRAQITTRHPSETNAPVQLNRGTRQGVATSSIAVYNGVHLIGRVAEVSAVSCSLHPVTDAATGLIRAAVLPAADDTITVKEAARVALKPTGDGALLGEVARDRHVKPGDTVRLFDSAWPVSAQAMIIGIVVDVHTKDDQPLRNEIVVKPRYTVAQLSDVTLIVEDQSAGSAERSASRGVNYSGAGAAAADAGGGPAP
jgi:cell shape-determining protein MreC